MKGADSLGALRAKMQRRTRVLVAIPLIVAVSAGLAAANAMGSGANLWVDGLVLFALAASLSAPIVLATQRLWVRRAIAAFEPFRPMVREARFALLLGYELLLESGLILRSDRQSYSVSFTGFYAASGEPLVVPLREAARWSVWPRGMKEVGAVYAKGPSETKEAMRRLSEAFQSSSVNYLILYESRQIPTDPAKPRWFVSLDFGLSFWWKHASALAREIDDISRFMDDVRQGRYGVRHEFP